ncbi:MAG: diguanylate cyclase [Kangiellaceae bacterium]|jgi:diguanylate cyclase (GGDEF)-like protein|nr:diguanylate cyclase [Kangiellaceae bacterium]
MKKTRYVQLLILCFLTFPTYCVSNTGLNANIKVISVEDGLPQSTVRAIAQDSRHLMYFATDDGISQFDGFSHHYINDTVSSERKLFSFNDLCIIGNTLWSPSLDGGVYRYDIEQAKSYELLISESQIEQKYVPVDSCAIDINLEVYFSTSNSIFKVDSTSNEFEVLVEDDSLKVNKIYISNNNLFLVATDQGIKVLNENKLLDLDLPGLANREVVDIVVESEQVMWVATKKQLLKYVVYNNEWLADDNLIVHAFNRNLNGSDLSGIYVATENRVFVSTENRGVFMFDEQSEQVQRFYRESARLAISDNYIADVFQSVDGTLWFGSWLGGINKVDLFNRGIVSYDFFPLIDGRELDRISIRAIYKVNEQLFLGTDGSGLLSTTDLSGRYQQEAFDGTKPNSLPNNNVRAITAYKDDSLLIGTDKGIMIRDSMNQYRPLVSGGIVESNQQTGEKIRSISYLENSLWVGSYDLGLTWFDFESNKFNRLKLTNNSPFDFVTNIVRGEDNLLWVATDNSGVYVVDKNSKKVIKHFKDDDPERLRSPGNLVWGLAIIDDAVWFGSYGQGLGRFDMVKGVFDYFRETDGLTNDVVYSIIEDSNGLLWSSTNYGLASFTKSGDSFTKYTKSDGLPNNEFNSGAYYKTDDMLYFGTVSGLAVIEPRRLSVLEGNHKLFLDTFSINGKKFRNNNQQTAVEGFLLKPTSITIAFDYDVLTFNIAATDYRQPDKLSFSYQLVGFDNQWQTLELGNRSIRYTGLPHGNYQLLVQAKNINGKSELEPLNFQLILQPPWWLSEWAYISYVIAIMILFWAIYESIVRFKAKNREMVVKLNHLVELRTNELNNKNTELLRLNEELKAANVQLEKVSMTDALTGLGNRRMLEQFLERDVPDTNRAYIAYEQLSGSYHDAMQNDLLFFMIDLDHFKSINDTYGHSVGDRVLLDLCKLLETIIREGDYIIRYGGEEFLLVIRNTPRTEAEEICKRIQVTVNEFLFMIGDGQAINVTCSVGFAPYPFAKNLSVNIPPKDVIKLADYCLYCAKESGRDQWVGIIGNKPQVELTTSDVMNATYALIETRDISVISSNDEDKLIWPIGSVN